MVHIIILLLIIVLILTQPELVITLDSATNNKIYEVPSWNTRVLIF